MCESGTGTATGLFVVAGIFHNLLLDYLWLETNAHSGISREYFDKYFAGKTQGSVITCGSIVRMKPLSIRHFVRPNGEQVRTVPQSFFYTRTVLVKSGRAS